MAEFQDYPKRLTTPDGKRVRVFNRAEEDELMAQWKPKAEAPPAPVVVEPVAVAPEDIPQDSKAVQVTTQEATPSADPSPVADPLGR